MSGACEQVCWLHASMCGEAVSSSNGFSAALVCDKQVHIWVLVGLCGCLSLQCYACRLHEGMPAFLGPVCGLKAREHILTKSATLTWRPHPQDAFVCAGCTTPAEAGSRPAA